MSDAEIFPTKALRKFLSVLGSRQRYTASLTFWPSEFSRLRLQSSVDRPGWRDAIWAGFLTLEVAVGAHAAHAF